MVSPYRMLAYHSIAAGSKRKTQNEAHDSTAEAPSLSFNDPVRNLAPKNGGTSQWARDAARRLFAMDHIDF